MLYWFIFWIEHYKHKNNKWGGSFSQMFRHLIGVGLCLNLILLIRGKLSGQQFAEASETEMSYEV